MILYLPGFSLKNKSELEIFSNEFEKNDLKYYAHEWLHWGDENTKFNFDKEIQRILDQIQLERHEELKIIAKSIGTITTIRMLRENKMNPSQIILMGIPLAGSNSNDVDLIKQVLEKVKEKTTIIQNTKDPHGSFEQIKNLVQGMNIQLVSREEDNHIYECPQLVMELLG